MKNSIEQFENGTPIDKVITLKGVFKTGALTVMPVPDGMGWYLGIPRLSEAQKATMTYWAEPNSKFKISENTRFDLTNEIHKVTWAWVKHLPEIAEDFEACQSSKSALFYISMENKEAAIKVSRREERFKAEAYVMRDDSANYAKRALLLGVDMSNEDPLIIKEYLLDCVNSQTKDVLAIYESHDLSLKILLLDAKKANIITSDGGGICRYGTTILGTTDDSCIVWMQDPQNKHLVATMEEEVKPDYIKVKVKEDPMAAVKAAQKDKERETAATLLKAADEIAKLREDLETANAATKAANAKAKKAAADATKGSKTGGAGAPSK